MFYNQILIVRTPTSEIYLARRFNQNRVLEQEGSGRRGGGGGEGSAPRNSPPLKSDKTNEKKNPNLLSGQQF